MNVTGETRTSASLTAAAQPPATRTRAEVWYSAVRKSIRTYPLDWVLAAAATALALGLYLHYLGTVSVWFDEAFSYVETSQRFSAMWASIWGREPNMELYYLLLYFWIKATALLHVPTNEFVLRLPSVASAVLSVPFVYLIARHLWSTGAAITASVLYAANPLQLFYAQQARAYSLETLLCCVSWYALLVALTTPSERRRPWALYIAATVLAIYAHVFSGLVVLAQVAAFGALLALPGAWRAPARRALPGFVASLGIAGVLILPMIYVSRNGGHNVWVPPATPPSVPDFFTTSVAGGNTWYLAVLGVACVMTAGLVAWEGTRHIAWLTPGNETPADMESSTAPPLAALGVVVMISWLVVPLVLSYALTQQALNLHLFLARYLVVTVPALCILAGAGVSLIRWRAPQTAFAVALIAVALAQVPTYYAQADTQGFRAATLWLEQRYQPGDGIACYPGTWCRLPMNYYLAAYPSLAHFDADSPDTPGSTMDTATLAAYAAKHTRVFLITAIFDPSPTDRARLSALQAWMDAHYHFAGQYSSSYLSTQFIQRPLVTSVTIRLYDRLLGAAAPSASSGVRVKVIAHSSSVSDVPPVARADLKGQTGQAPLW